MSWVDWASCAECGKPVSRPDYWTEDMPPALFLSCVHVHAGVVPLKPVQGQLPLTGVAPMTAEALEKGILAGVRKRRKYGSLFE